MLRLLTHPVKEIPGVGGVDGGKLFLHLLPPGVLPPLQEYPFSQYDPFLHKLRNLPRLPNVGTIQSQPCWSGISLKKNGRMKSPRWLKPRIGHTNFQDSQIMSSTLSFNYLSWLVLKDLDKLFFESARTRGESCEPQEQKGWFPFCQGAPWHRLWRTGQEKNTWRRVWFLSTFSRNPSATQEVESQPITPPKRKKVPRESEEITAFMFAELSSLLRTAT